MTRPPTQPRKPISPAAALRDPKLLGGQFPANASLVRGKSAIAVFGTETSFWSMADGVNSDEEAK